MASFLHERFVVHSPYYIVNVAVITKIKKYMHLGEREIFMQMCRITPYLKVY